MVNPVYTRYQAHDRSYFAVLKKEIHHLAAENGFSKIKLAHIDIIIAEITSNLLKYASGHAEILVAVVSQKASEYIEIISIDNGPGMLDLSKMVMDGVSTSNTMGHGLGSIKRLSDYFSVYSLKKWGTILLCRLYKHEGFKELNQIQIRSLTVAKATETVSGDGSAYKLNDRYFKLLEMDGLGHGPEANDAVKEAVRAFQLCPYHSPSEIIRYIHEAIKKTRGGVGAVAVYDFHLKQWLVAGIGNITIKLVNAVEVKNLMSYNGTIGHNIPELILDQKIKTDNFKQVIMCSDGIKSRWELSKYPGIHRYDPSIIAAAIYKDYASHTDDMSVVIAKINI